MDEETKETIRKAKNGDADARYDLANMFEAGLGGLEVDEAKAREWYQKAAEVGHREARMRLALELLLEAYGWLNILTQEGDNEAKVKKELLERGMSSKEIAAAKEYSELLR